MVKGQKDGASSSSLHFPDTSLTATNSLQISGDPEGTFSLCHRSFALKLKDKGSSEEEIVPFHFCCTLGKHSWEEMYMWDSVTPVAFGLLPLLCAALLLPVTLVLCAEQVGYQMLFRDVPAVKFCISDSLALVQTSCMRMI